METDFEVTLGKTDGEWAVRRTASLENALTGGLISCLSDPMLLTAPQTLDVCLNTIKEMDLKQFSDFIGLASGLYGYDEKRNEIANALCEQAHKYFDYALVSEKQEGYPDSKLRLSFHTWFLSQIL